MCSVFSYLVQLDELPGLLGGLLLRVPVERHAEQLGGVGGGLDGTVLRLHRLRGLLQHQLAVVGLFA